MGRREAAPSLLELVKNMQNNIYPILLRVYKLLFWFMGKVIPKDANMIIFESFHGKQYSDNPRALYEYLNEKHPDYNLIWSADRRHLVIFSENGVQYVQRFSLKWLWFMNRAKYWVINTRLPLWIPKTPRTTYVQTWHGTPLKRLAADMNQVLMPETDTEKYKQNFLYEAGKWDYLISPNPYSTEIFKHAFAFDKQIIESGYPRNDYLITHNNAEKITSLKEEMGIPLNKNVILYAPTWRDNQFYQKGQYKFDIQMNLQQMKSEFGDEYVILLRMHYLISENIDLKAYKGFVYDFSSYEDIRDLYLVSDLLITDYSSVLFDYANLKRPMLFFVYDLDDYRDNLRGFYFDFEQEAPGPLVKTTNEIIAAIRKLENEHFKPDKTVEAFYQKFCRLEDGMSSERVVKRIWG